MLNAILWSLLLTTGTALLHIWGSLALIHGLRNLMARKRKPHRQLKSYILFLARIAALLLMLHCLEATLWAVFYQLKGAVPDFESALYFSLTSYSTIGYGDMLLPPGIRLTGALEGLVGTFMCGWSVALLVALIHNLLKQPAQPPQ